MERPTEDDLAALVHRRVRLVVPKPREDMRLVGRVATEDDDPVLHVDDPSADRFGVVRLRERDRDAVLRAYRADGTLLGRVRHLAALEKSGEG